MAKFEPVATANLMTAFAQVFPGHEGNRQLRSFIFTAMDALRGILISNFVEPDPTRARRRWDRSIEGLRTSGREALRTA